MDDALNQSIECANESFRLLKEAIMEQRDNKISVRLGIFNKAQEARFKAEEAHRAELERRQILIPVAFAKETTGKVITAILSRLDVLPQNVAVRCNPGNPHLAMAVLENECVAIRKFAQQSIS